MYRSESYTNQLSFQRSNERDKPSQRLHKQQSNISLGQQTSQGSLQRKNARDKQSQRLYKTTSNTSLGQTSLSSKRSHQSLKSILSSKSFIEKTTKSKNNSSENTTGSSDSFGRRRAHFDKQNIDLTYKPLSKEYGHLRITQANTPFPRKSQVPPINELEKASTRASAGRLFYEESRISIPITLPRPLGSKRSDAPVEMDFLTKRKIFHRGEFTITRQRKPIQVHPPLNSIQLTAYDQPSCVGLTQFFRKHHRQRHQTIASEITLV